MKIGLVLSGGGARGILHLGVIKGLHERGLLPHFISGTSAGAIAGALIAHGHTPDEVLQIILKTNFLKYFRPSFSGSALLRMDKLENLFLQHLPHNRFEQLHLPLTVTATDIEKGESLHFESGELIRPLMASSCLPGIFEPIHFQKRVLVDGAVLNNMPVEPLLGKADFIIGVNCNKYALDKPIRSIRGILERSILLAIRNKTNERIKQCQVVFEPTDIGRYDIFDVRKARDIFHLGYRAVKQSDELTHAVEKYLSSTPTN